MLKIDSRQQAMLKEMGIALPWEASALSGEVDMQPQEQVKTSDEPLTAQQENRPQSTHHTPIRERLQRAQHEPAEVSSEAAALSSPAQEPSSRADAIARMSWTELQEAVKHCDACALRKSCTQTVFSGGLPTAKWMIVGEAPGEQEDKQGEPFVGQAGKLLDRMLLPLNLSRKPEKDQQPVYIANAIKCRPPRNRNPEPHEMVQCEPFLKRQIELIQPQVILIMGRFAVQTLLKTHEAIGRLRGQVHTYNHIPAVVTYHPAYLLRNPVDKRKAWADLCLAAQVFSKAND